MLSSVVNRALHPHQVDLSTPLHVVPSHTLAPATLFLSCVYFTNRCTPPGIPLSPSRFPPTRYNVSRKPQRGHLMNYRRFGKTGWNVSEIGYGMWGLAGWTGSDDTESLDS